MMKPAYFQIRVRGYLTQDWQDWFHGLTISHPEEDITMLSGQFIDQAALYGILTRLHDLMLPLVSVQEVSADDQPL